jgi:GT2 family glycosyltransferase
MVYCRLRPVQLMNQPPHDARLTCSTNQRVAMTARTDQPKRVEVLIASYNTCELLRTCLRSLFAHVPDAPDIRIEAAVLDNASRDGSADMVAGEFPHVRLVRSATNVGFARANNRLASSSTADYLMLLNSDVVLTMDVVSPLLEVLESDPRIAVVGPMLISADGTVQPSSQRFPSLPFELSILFGYRLKQLIRSSRLHRALDGAAQSIGQHAIIERRIHDAEHLWATCWLLRRPELGAHGLFDERFVTYDEDLDFCRRLRAVGRRVVWVPDVQLVHLGGQSSDRFTRLALQGYGRRTYYSLHHGTVFGVAYATMSTAAILLKRAHARLQGMRRFLAQSRNALPTLPLQRP